MKEKEIKNDNMLTVHMMSAYHCISRTSVRIYQKNQKSNTSDMFSVKCVFIDHVSGYIRIKNKLSINDTENDKAEFIFERESQSQIFVIKR